MRLNLWLLCAAVCVCVSASIASVVWLGSSVFKTYAMRDAEIRTARIVKLIQISETSVARDWRSFIEKLDTIPTDEFSERTCREITEGMQTRFPIKIFVREHFSEGMTKKLKKNFSVFRENENYFLLRERENTSIQGLVFPQKELFEVFEKRAQASFSHIEKVGFRIVSVSAESGFGIIRGVPGAKIELDLATRESVDSVAAKRAVWIAGAGILLMLSLVLFLSLRIFSLSEKHRLFASAVSHELKTPLAELRVCVTSALSKNSSSSVHDELLAIKQSQRNINAIVENMLIFSRLRLGLRYLRQVTLTVDELLSRIFPRVGERLVSANMDATLDADLQLRSRQIRTSVEMIGQILFNLADNVAKYAYREGGENLVRFRISAHGKKLFIDIEDEGFGIPVDRAKRIFAPLGRDNSENEKHGLGLGLVISARAAKYLGGKLSLIKSDSTGTIFRLELPLLTK